MEKESRSENGSMAAIAAALTPEQAKAIAQKAGKLKVDFLKEASVEGLTDVVVAYYVVKARKEADDSIFSESKQFLYFDIRRWYESFVSDADNVRAAAESVFDKVIETCKHDVGRLKTLAGMLRTELLAGRTEIPAEKLEAFVKAIGYLGIAPESLK